ncbi:hypothetical protein VNO80_33222 [Phaseolus coccineus]|uniref:Uncharacterized protein n=1 Tax=Phaseolus coccineus TaxID=3886 RepID=A0AAN9Q8S8_PHACN
MGRRHAPYVVRIRHYRSGHSSMGHLCHPGDPTVRDPPRDDYNPRQSMATNPVGNEMLPPFRSRIGMSPGCRILLDPVPRISAFPVRLPDADCELILRRAQCLPINSRDRGQQRCSV